MLIEWDPEHLYRRLIPDGAARARFLTEVCTPAWNLEQDRGRTWAAAVAERTALLPAHAALIAAYDMGWQAMMPGAIPGSVAVLAELEEAGVPPYVITNFSAEKFVETVARFPFLGRFRGTIVSAHEGRRPGIRVADGSVRALRRDRRRGRGRSGNDHQRLLRRP